MNAVHRAQILKARTPSTHTDFNKSAFENWPKWLLLPGKGSLFRDLTGYLKMTFLPRSPDPVLILPVQKYRRKHCGKDIPPLHHFLLLHLWLFSVASQAPSRESQQITHYPLGNWQVKKSYLPSTSGCSAPLMPHASSY